MASQMEASGLKRLLESLPAGVRRPKPRSAAHRLRQEHAALLRLSHDAIIVSTAENGIELWSQGAAALYGYTGACFTVAFPLPPQR